MKQHQCTIHEKSDMFSCTECDYTTLRKSNLDRRLKRHANTPLSPNFSPKVACRDPIPNIIDSSTSDHFLEHQEMKDMITTQVRFGVTPTDIPDEVRQFFKKNNHGEQTKIFVKFMFEIFMAFVILKPIIAMFVFFSDIYTTIALLSLKPLPMPLRIPSDVKPMLLRSTSLFLLFCNTERLESFDIITPAITTSC